MGPLFRLYLDDGLVQTAGNLNFRPDARGIVRILPDKDDHHIALPDGVPGLLLPRIGGIRLSEGAIADLVVAVVLGLAEKVVFEFVILIELESGKDVQRGH